MNEGLFGKITLRRSLNAAIIFLLTLYGFRLNAQPNVPSVSIGTIIYKDHYRGTGFVAMTPKTVITCYHVVKGIGNVFQYQAEGENRVYDLTFEDSIPHKDLAILKCKDSISTPLPIGMSSLIMKGDSITYAGFNSYGSKDKMILVYDKVDIDSILLDVNGMVHYFAFDHNFPESFSELKVEILSIHGGYSGGPILNELMEVIGVISYIKFLPVRNSNRSSETLVFSMPADALLGGATGVKE